MKSSYINIIGATEHNLKNISLKIPRDKLTVITGLSGSGKSSLAFDTVYAEGQRRYVESLSSYARQFLEQLQKPKVEHIEGLSPSISIEQRTSGKNPRSTVGTQTEIFDYLRLLFARIGKQHCPKCKKPISTQTLQQIVDKIVALKNNTRILLLAPIIQGKKGEHIEEMKNIRRNGFIRLRLDGEIIEIADNIPRLNKKVKHTIEAVIDRIVIKEGLRQRLSDSVEAGLRIGNGVIVAALLGEDNKIIEEIFFSEHNACLRCGISFEKLLPRNFSFNSPYGACPECNGLGNLQKIDKTLLVPDQDEPLIRAILPWKRGGKGLILHYRRMLRRFCRAYGIDYEKKFKDLAEKEKKLILYGDPDTGFEGVINNLERRFHTSSSDYIKEMISFFMSPQPCPACKGMRLKKESLSVYVDGRNISDITALSTKAAIKYFEHIKLSKVDAKISEDIVKEIKGRLDFLVNVGLDYLTLDRKSNTLSGGEDQRIRLATQIGAGLVGVLYVLDEPSIGLHQRDNNKLLNTLLTLRDMGNTLIVVEHDEATIRKADFVVDLGPGAGEHGGEIVEAGPVSKILESKRSLTGKYLRGEIKIEIPPKRKLGKAAKYLEIIGAKEHNLRDIHVKIPLGVFNCITGVSGSGKSTLVHDILYRALAKKFYRAKVLPGEHKQIKGMQYVDKVIVIDQSPIGRTPRSNPATYTGCFDHIRKLFSALPESRVRGYKPGRFSFNVKGGRCEACAGDGMKKIEMHFLPDVYVRCQVCGSKRFNDQTLEVKYKGLDINQVLESSVEEAIKIFANITPVQKILQTLNDVGLGYIRLGQQATTLSGGEAQRVKLATELAKTATGNTLYLLDEPTTGLHFADIHKLLEVLQRLVDKGNTVIVIEHNMDVIKSADHLIDLGPGGGDAGGEIVFSGPPDKATESKRSYTGKYLDEILKKGRKNA